MPAKRKAKRDEDIAEDVRRALRLDNDVPDERIRVHVEGGSVTLEGNVELALQKGTAEADAKRVRGVTEVMNRILVEPSLAGTTGR